MNTKIKITLLFTISTMILVSVLCLYIYYEFYNLRIETIKAQLINRALTTANLINQRNVYNDTIIKKIDATPWLSIRDKAVQAYNNNYQRIFTYADKDGDTISVQKDILHEARQNKTIFYSEQEKDVVVHYDEKSGISVVSAAYDESGLNNLRRMKTVLWIAFTTSILITFISGYFFSKLLLRPVKKIADEVTHISAQNLELRLESGKANDEWEYLSKTLNGLLGRLQESFQIQRRFVSSASHELSTPLTAISSQLEVLLFKNRTVKEYQDVASSVYSDVQQLRNLTNTLLEFSTIAEDAGGIELKPVRIDEILMLLPAEMKKLNKGFNVKLDFQELPTDEHQLIVYGNEQLLLSAIKNIVSNACKYSLDHTAKVNLSVNDESIIVSVEDEGKGISEDELKNIFKPFYRTQDSKPMFGFGIGLSLVKRIIRLHRGEVNVSSIIGKGTIFKIHLPVAGSSSVK